MKPLAALHMRVKPLPSHPVQRHGLVLPGILYPNLMITEFDDYVSVLNTTAYPDVDPAYDTQTVTVSGADENSNDADDSTGRSRLRSMILFRRSFWADYWR